MQQVRKWMAAVGTALTMAAVLATASPVLAYGDQQITVTTPITSGTQVTGTLFRIILVVSVILFVILVLVGGIQYLGSFGNEEATTKAKKLIIDAVVGLFIVLAAFGIASFVFGQLGVGVTGGISNYITPSSN